MRTTPSISQPESLVLRPHKMQFVIDELPSLAVCCAGGIYGGMEGVPYPVAGVAVFFCLSLVLLYRFIYLCRTQYVLPSHWRYWKPGLSQCYLPK